MNLAWETETGRSVPISALMMKEWRLPTVKNRVNLEEPATFVSINMKMMVLTSSTVAI